jgi:hypothetical protein
MQSDVGGGLKFVEYYDDEIGAARAYDAHLAQMYV